MIKAHSSRYVAAEVEFQKYLITIVLSQWLFRLFQNTEQQLTRVVAYSSDNSCETDSTWLIVWLLL